MKRLLMIALCSIALSSNAQSVLSLSPSKSGYTVLMNDTLTVDSSQVKFIRIGKDAPARRVNQKDTVIAYVIDKVDTSGVTDMLIEDSKGRISKTSGRYIYVHKLVTLNGKEYFNFPSKEVIIGALDNKQRRVKPYLNGTGQ